MSRLDRGVFTSQTSPVDGPARPAQHVAHPPGRMVAADYVIGSGRQLTVPRLDGIAMRHQFAFGVQPAARLCHTLMEAGIAEADDWNYRDRNPLAFAEKTLHRWATDHGAAEIGTQFDLALALVSDLDPYAEERSTSAPIERMYLILEPETAGYLVLGPVLRRLEAAHALLPATFLHLFSGALNRWVRVYDYRDALERVEMLREWYEGDPEAEHVELPDVDGATPDCLRQRKPVSPRFAARLTNSIRDRSLRSVLEAVLDLSVEAAKIQRPEIGDEVSERLADCNPPLPALLAVFEKHDAIEGCFDEESQGMMECQPEPNIILPLTIGDVRSVKHSFAVAEVICDVLLRAARLMKLLMADVD